MLLKLALNFQLSQRAFVCRIAVVPTAFYVRMILMYTNNVETIKCMFVGGGMLELQNSRVNLIPQQAELKASPVDNINSRNCTIIPTYQRTRTGQQ